MGKSRLILLFCALIVLQGVSAEAQPCCPSFEFEFGGTVTSVMDFDCVPPWDQINVGDPWSVVYTFKSCTPDSTPQVTRGDYYGAITSYTLTIGSVIPVSDSNPSGIVGTNIAVFDNLPAAWDQYEVYISLPNGYGWFMQLDGSNTNWNTDELPLYGDIVLPNFSIKDFSLSDMMMFDCEINGSVDWHNCMPDPDIKWQQCPDETELGIDIRMDRNDGIPRVLADDFLCTDNGLITGVRFWASWKYDMVGFPYLIHLSIHEDIPDPDGPGPDYSRPGTLVWEMDFDPTMFTETLYLDLFPLYEWWWDPYSAGDPDPFGDHLIWQYDIAIDPNDAFLQTGQEMSSRKTHVPMRM